MCNTITKIAVNISGDEPSKRRRIDFSAKQIVVLEDYFSHTKFITASERYKIAMELNVDERRVRLWFNNRRRKQRNIESGVTVKHRRFGFSFEIEAVLEDIFIRSKFVSRCERIRIAEQLNLSERKVQIWFKNRRSQEKQNTSFKPVSVRNDVRPSRPQSQASSTSNTSINTTIPWHQNNTANWSPNEIDNWQQYQNSPYQQPDSFQVAHSVHQPDYENQMLSSNQQMTAISHQTPYPMTMGSFPDESLSTATTSPHFTYNDHENDWIRPCDINISDVEAFIQQQLEHYDLESFTQLDEDDQHLLNDSLFNCINNTSTNNFMCGITTYLQEFCCELENDMLFERL